MLQPNGVDHNSTTTNGTSGNSTYDVYADYLIVGTGPAGASLACFLTQHGKQRGSSERLHEQEG